MDSQLSDLTVPSQHNPFPNEINSSSPQPPDLHHILNIQHEALQQQQPLSPNGQHHSELDLEQDRTPSSAMTKPTPVTRTVAIIKNHALQYRFDIEPRIQGASFEIVKERQMEFDTETDPDALYDLFGEDADSLAEGPVWVYVLERKRAVEVWTTLMGDRDPEVARLEAPNSLRALYGLSRQQNALMGSPDTQTAEFQISALFASSPPFPTSDLPNETDRYNSVGSVSSSIAETLRTDPSDGYGRRYTGSNMTSPSTANGGLKGKILFRARPLPATTDQPDIVPRMSRAAALRIGAYVEKVPNKPRGPPTKEQTAKTFANVPGHKRVGSIAVASTAPPVIAPRMTKAATLRIAKEAAGNGNGNGHGFGVRASPMKTRPATIGVASAAERAEKAKTTFDGIPGHKRRETISVASVKPPTVAPRTNKSAALRQLPKDGATPVRAPTISRTASAETSPTSSRRQSIAPRPTLTTTAHRRATSVLAVRTPLSTDFLSPTGSINTGGASSSGAGDIVVPARASSVAATRPRPRPSSAAGPPTIAPRTNRSAALRAAKMEAEAAAAAAAAAKKKAPKSTKPPPSSFKAGTVAI